METGELTRADIRKLVRDYVKSDLDSFELEQATGRPGNHGTVDDDLDAIDTALHQSKMALAMRRHGAFMGLSLENLLADAGLPKIDQNTTRYQVLTREPLKASIRVLEAQMSLLVGNPQSHDLVGPSSRISEPVPVMSLPLMWSLLCWKPQLWKPWSPQLWPMSSRGARLKLASGGPPPLSCETPLRIRVPIRKYRF